MSLLLAFVVLGATSRCSAKPPPVELVTDEVQLGTSDYIFTNKHRDSHMYRFPDWSLTVSDGSNLRLFGVNTTETFTLHLYDAAPETQSHAVTGSRPMGISITKSLGKWNVKHSEIRRIYKDSFKMPGDKFVWFIIETTNSYVALYRVGEPRPMVLLSNYIVKSRFNYNKFQWYSVSSSNDAVWDFQGFKFDTERKREMNSNPFLQVAAQRLRKTYRQVIDHLENCKNAGSRKVFSSTEELKAFLSYIQGTCMKPKLSVKYRDMLLRLKSILTALGMPLSAPPTEANSAEYILKKKCIKV